MSIVRVFVFARALCFTGGNQLGRQIVHPIRPLRFPALEQRRQGLLDSFFDLVPQLRLFLLRRGDQPQLRRQFIDQLLDQLAFLFFAALQQFGGHAQPHRQQRYQREQRCVGQRRCAHRTAVSHKTLSHQHPEMGELLERVKMGLVHRRNPALIEQHLRFGMELFDLRDRIFGHAAAV